MTHKWEHQWQNVGALMFWCAKCGALQGKGDPTMYQPVGGGWRESPIDCVVLEDGPDDEQLPPPPGDADESRVASLRSSWAYIGVGKPGMRSVQQEMKPDVMYLLDLAEEALRRRREQGA